MERLRELDLLRFLAALGVLLFHFTGYGGGPWPQPASRMFPEFTALTHYGYLGVDLFFVISGFVILMSAWGRSAGEFGVSRVVRLMPAYWASVLLAGVIYLTLGMGNGSLQRVLPNLTMLQAGLGVDSVEGVYWTLWLELRFYLMIAVLAAVGITYRRCVVFMTGWLFLGLFAQAADARLLLLILMPSYSSYFIAGMALYLIYRYGPSLLLWGFVGTGWLLSLHWGAWRAGRTFYSVSDVLVQVVVTVIFAVMILMATRRLTWLRWRGLTVLGALTYPLYLFHVLVTPPLIELIYPAVSRWVALAAAIATSMLVAYLVHRWLERPVQAWMRPRLRQALELLGTADEPSPRPAAGPVPASRRPQESPVSEPVDATPVPVGRGPVRSDL